MKRYIALSALALLAGCAGATLPQIATDANLIAAGMTGIVAQVAAVPGVDPTKIALAQSYLKTIQEDAATIAGTSTPSTTTVNELAQTAETLAPLALSLVPGGAPWVPVLDAVLTLAPQLVAELMPTAASAVAPGASTMKYSPAEARLILNGAAH